MLKTMKNYCCNALSVSCVLIYPAKYKKKEIFKPGIIFKKINDLGIFYIIRKSILEKQKTKKTSTTVPTLIKSYLKILSSACGKFFLSCDTIWFLAYIIQQLLFKYLERVILAWKLTKKKSKWWDLTEQLCYY